MRRRLPLAGRVMAGPASARRSGLAARCLPLALCLASALCGDFAAAHRFAPSRLKMFETGEHRYQVTWKTPVQRVSGAPLLPVFPDNCAVTGGDPATLEGSGVVSGLQLHCAGGLAGRQLAVSGLADNRAAALLSLQTREGHYYQALLDAARPAFTVPAEPSASEVARDYAWLGAEHIASGIDHLLFVFGLLLLVGWRRRLAWTVTAFTLGHSVTLSLVTLGWFEYPVAPVEFAIALSIFMLALELARRDGGGLFRRHPGWLAAGFGLLHGMGFAGALADIGLPQAEVPLALLFFNVGIELGQLAFIGAVAGLWFAARRFVPRAWDGPRLLPAPVYLLGALSAFWCIERGLEMF